MTSAEVYETVVSGVYHVVVPGGFGTAFLARSDGVALTNHHVITGETMVQLQTREGAVLSAPVVSVDRDNDLAALFVPSKDDLPTPLELAGPDATRVGDEVVAIGHPAASAPFSLSQGVVAALQHVQQPHRLLIQANISVNWGNSGGPLLSLSGHTVGVVTLINFTPNNQRLEGVCFAVPATVARDFLATIPDMSEGLMGRRYCPICCNLVRDETYCSHCGSPKVDQDHDSGDTSVAAVSSKSGACEVCATKNPAGARYCKACGVRL